MSFRCLICLFGEPPPQGGKRDAPTHQIDYDKVAVPSKYLTDVQNNVLERCSLALFVLHRPIPLLATLSHPARASAPSGAHPPRPVSPLAQPHRGR